MTTRLRCLLFVLAGIGCARPPAEARRPAEEAAAYHRAVARIDSDRLALARRLARVTKPVDRARVLRAARRTFESAVVDQLAPRWLGTRWGFSGVSEVPRRGVIACGYFVTTLLRHVGLMVERVKLAQQASERIITTITTPGHIKRFRQVSLRRFLEGIYAQGDGLFIVGLDYHVGLLYVAGGRGRFIHSSAQGCPTHADGCVIDERAERSAALENSRYRVVGRISADRELLKKWLQGTPILVETAARAAPASSRGGSGG